MSIVVLNQWRDLLNYANERCRRDSEDDAEDDEADKTTCISSSHREGVGRSYAACADVA